MANEQLLATTQFVCSGCTVSVLTMSQAALGGDSENPSRAAIPNTATQPAIAGVDVRESDAAVRQEMLEENSAC
jgi:hypothetical protein